MLSSRIESFLLGTGYSDEERRDEGLFTGEKRDMNANTLTNGLGVQPVIL